MNSVNDIWEEIKKILSGTLNPTTISTWFTDCEPISLDNMRLVICVKNEFTRDIIKSRFSDKVKAALFELFSCDFDFMVLTPDELEGGDRIDSKEGPLPQEAAAYTFDRFIIGNSNKFAYGAAKAVASHPGDRDYNPFFIYGNSGLGKTHLLFAIGQSVQQEFPNKKIAYVKGDEFTNKLVNSLQNRKMEEFRNEFRNVDLFLMDDVQFIAGKESTQEEFFNTFNSIYEAGHQIVITSDRPPKEMQTLEDRLRSRFEGGMLADIQPPDFETRVVIIRNKAAQLGLVLSEESVNYIANNVTANVRQIEGVIKKLTAYKEILNETITPDSVERAISDVTKNDNILPTPERIIKETARYYNISEEELKGQNRSTLPAEARQVAMYLMRTLIVISLKDIGRYFDNRNHATVLSSIRKIEDIMKSDPAMKSKIRDISSNISAG